MGLCLRAAQPGSLPHRVGCTHRLAPERASGLSASRAASWWGPQSRRCTSGTVVLLGWCDHPVFSYRCYTLKVDKVYRAVYADTTVAIIPCRHQIVAVTVLGRLSPAGAVASVRGRGGNLGFCVTSLERKSRGLAPCAQRSGPQRGLAITLARAIIASPHAHEEVSSWSL